MQSVAGPLLILAQTGTTGESGGSTTSWAPIATVGAALIAGVVAVYVARRTHKRNQELELEKRAWEREKLRLEQDLTAKRERAAESREEVKAQRAREAETAERRLADLTDRKTGEQEVDTYRELLCRELSRLRILDMAKPLDLRELYVNLRVRDDARTRFPREDERSAPEEENPLVIIERAHDELLASAATAVSPEDAVKEYSRIVVVGDPGAGKTTMLRHLALTNADSGERLPFYVELKGFVDSSTESLLSYVAEQCQDRYGFASAPQQIDELMQSGKAILLLDGLDETLGGGSAEEARDAYNLVTRQVNQLVARYPDAPIALTCRRAGWEGGVEAFRILEVLDFSHDQVALFIDRWFADDAAKRRDLVLALDRNPRMRSLAANPLLLSLISIVFDRDLELPERRSELYNRCVEVLLKEWDSHRGIKRYSQFTTDRKKDLLVEIAWHFHCMGERYFSEEALLEQIADYLPTIDLAPGKAEEILAEIAAQYGLLKQQAQGLYGFLHLTLQEYFAAGAANDRGLDAIQLVASRVHRPWWEEVGLLLAGRMSDASPFLSAVLRHPTGKYRVGDRVAPDDNVLAQDLVFAARCLTGTPRIRTEGLREAIIAAVTEVARDRQTSAQVGPAAKVLAEMGDLPTISDLLRRLPDRSVDVRMAILASLTSAPSQIASDELIRFVSQARRATPGDRTIVLREMRGRKTAAVDQIIRQDLASGASDRVTAAVRALHPPLDASWSGPLRHALSWAVGRLHTDDRVLVAELCRALADVGDPEALPLMLDSQAAMLARPGWYPDVGAQAVLRLDASASEAAIIRWLVGGDSGISLDDIDRVHLLDALRSVEPGEATCAVAVDLATRARYSTDMQWAATEVLGAARQHGAERLQRLYEGTYADDVRTGAACGLIELGEMVGRDLLTAAALDPRRRGDLQVTGRSGRSTTWYQRRNRRLAACLHAMSASEAVAEELERQIAGQLSGRSKRLDYEACQLLALLNAAAIERVLAQTGASVRGVDDRKHGGLIVLALGAGGRPSEGIVECAVEFLGRAHPTDSFESIGSGGGVEDVLHALVSNGDAERLEGMLLSLLDMEQPVVPADMVLDALSILAGRLQRRLANNASTEDPTDPS